MRLLSSVLAAAVLLGVSAASDDPKLEKKVLDNRPVNLFLFRDSEVALYVDSGSRTVYRSTDAGDEWTRVGDLPGDTPWAIYENPHNNKIAVALNVGWGKKHYITKDQGESWTSFVTDMLPSPLHNPLEFHAQDSDRILFQGQEECVGLTCLGKTLYTLDGFKTLDVLIERRRQCRWAKAEESFTTGDKDKDKNRILCLVEGYEPWKLSDHKLVISDNFFEDKHEPKMSDGRRRPGMTSMVPVKGYIVVSAKSEGSNEQALYTTTNSIDWHRAVFHDDHQVEEDAYTVLESTNHSLQIDVQTHRRITMGTLFTSNSAGTHFTLNSNHTNRNERGYVDFEKITNIEGIALVNTVQNWEDVEKSSTAEKKRVSRITFNAGRNFQPLKAGDADLHLHSFTEAEKERRARKIFSSSAPGIVMGIGNTGTVLKDYADGDLYVSNDAGVSWSKALDGPHMYEISGSGSVLVAIKQNKADKIQYSIDYGHSWETKDFGDTVKPQRLITIAAETGMKFILLASKGSRADSKWYLYHLDFERVFDTKCKKPDFEKWYAVDDGGDPTCIMGRKQWFRRRKADAKCFVGKGSRVPKPNFEPCACTAADYECDVNFVREDDKCVPIKALEPPEGECKNPEDTFKAPSGWRLIPGNKCDREDGVVKDKPIDRPCSDAKKSPKKGDITKSIQDVSGNFNGFYYLEKADTSSKDDETLVLHTRDGKVRVSHDHGKSWDDLFDNDVRITQVIQNPHFRDSVYFLTKTEKVYYSENRAKSIHSFDADHPPTDERNLRALRFHSKNPDWMIWTGSKGCPNNCRNIASYSTKGGDSWEALHSPVRKCQFVVSSGQHNASESSRHEKLVFCQHLNEDEGLDNFDLRKSENWFEKYDVLQENVVSFASMSEFVILAVRAKEDAKYLEAFSSVDGGEFAHARWPPSLEKVHEEAYTVLESSTHSVFLHVTVNNDEGKQFGHILKSNSNGTNYVLSVPNVNRGGIGYVDFEKMQNLEGVAFVNVVGNVEEVTGGEDKKLKTMATHNDGADWSLITPPEKDSEGQKFKCSDEEDKCSLHLRFFNERTNPAHSHSSESAIGLMVATGSVGEYLEAKDENSHTFITTDGGLSWKAISKGKYLWEYGDQGSIIVLVKWDEPTNEVKYSTDEGENWEIYQFSEEKYIIFELSTVPSDTSFNFLLWARKQRYARGTIPKLHATINLDFSAIFSRKCELDVDHPQSSKSDYKLWAPQHPKQKNHCLFGHRTQYYRRKAKANCSNNQQKELLRQHKVLKTCQCTKFDFECDYNYERRGDMSCTLVQGASKPDPKQFCYDNPEAVEYHEVTGFRRNPLTTCEGGQELDRASVAHPCPGHEDEYAAKHGVSGLALFFAIVVPFALAGAVGYYVWHSWGGKLGQIRLGDAGAEAWVLDRDSPWIQWPIAAVSGLVAVVASVPMLLGLVWRSVSGRFGRGYGGPLGRTYTTRSSFARGRGDYAAVDADEGELLGEESEEEW